MVHAEGYWALNAALCACALLLGGRLAGLAAPKAARLMGAGAISGAAAVAALYRAELGGLALAVLPVSVWLCYRHNGAQACVRCALTTLCAAMLSGGAATWLSSLGVGALAALGAAVALSLTLYLLATLLPTAACEVRQVELRKNGREVILPAMLDSGNLLRDPLTGLPVLVAPSGALKPLFPDVEELCELSTLSPGFRVLSVRTAAGGGLWPMFRPDRCRLYLNGKALDAKVLVAVAGREYGGVQALVPTSALGGGAEAAG